MNYDDFLLTLRDLLGFKLTGDPPTFDEMIATLQRDNSKSDEIHTQLCAAVDDLLAEAGYDTLFDTREKCLEALRQDIKAKLGTAPVDREVLAFKLAEAADPAYQASVLNRAYWLRAADAALRLIRPAPAAKVVDQEGLAKAMFEGSGRVVQWADMTDVGRGTWRNLAASALKYIGATSAADETRARELLSYEVRGLRTELADAQRQVGVWRDTAETQKKMRLDLAAEQDKLVAALDEAQDQLAAERERAEQSIAHYTTCSMQYRTDRDAMAAELAAERKKWPELKAEVERLKKLARARELTISLFEKIVLGHADPGAVMRDAETGETAHIAPDVQGALRRLVTHARPESHKPLDRDRIRLALLDFDPKVNTVGFINDLADHLLKRLA